MGLNEAIFGQLLAWAAAATVFVVVVTLIYVIYRKG